MFFEISPIEVLGTFVTNLDSQANNAEIANKYGENVSFYYDSHNVDIGRAGTLSVNDYKKTTNSKVYI